MHPLESSFHPLVSSLEPLGLSLDPLGRGPNILSICTTYVRQLLSKFGPRNQSSENVEKTRVQLLGKYGLESQISLNSGTNFPAQKY